MSGDSKRTLPRRTWSRWLAAGAVGLALLIAGCGGTSGGSSKASAEPSAPAASGSSAPEKTTEGSQSAGIPQNNGGDQDADNNGGPSDGDGNQ